MVKKNSSKLQTCIYLIVILLLLLLLSITIGTVFLNRPDTCYMQSSETVFSIIITCLAIFVATSVFLPRYIIHQLVDDVVSEKLNKIHINLQDEKAEILRVEAHEARMSAFYLVKHGEFEWALGWTLKALKIYMMLYMQKPFPYEEFIMGDPKKDSRDSLLDRLKEIERYLSDNSGGNSFISIRKWKDFFECLVKFNEMEEMNPNKSFSRTERDVFIKGRSSVYEFLKKAFEILKIQINKTEITVEDKERLFNRIRFENKELYGRFEKFLNRQVHSLDELLKNLDNKNKM